MEEINVMGELIITLNNFQEWVNNCPRHLPSKKSIHETWLWIDKMGNILCVGEDFQAALKSGTFPVNVYRLQRVSDVKTSPSKKGIVSEQYTDWLTELKSESEGLSLYMTLTQQELYDLFERVTGKKAIINN